MKPRQANGGLLISAQACRLFASESTAKGRRCSALFGERTRMRCEEVVFQRHAPSEPNERLSCSSLLSSVHFILLCKPTTDPPTHAVGSDASEVDARDAYDAGAAPGHACVFDCLRAHTSSRTPPRRTTLFTQLSAGRSACDEKSQ